MITTHPLGITMLVGFVVLGLIASLVVLLIGICLYKRYRKRRR